MQSERYSPMGNVASQGVLNQLGRPRMDLLTVLMREAVQNSWDAKRASAQQVRFGVSMRTLTSSQHKILKEQIFSTTPGTLGVRDLLHTDKPIQVLELWDRGTSGLGGPTRADTPEDSTEYRDFVDFLRNVGHPPDKKLGGGTFGYGKAALYLASRVHTICVHSHARYHDQPVSRFMAAALGEWYSLDGSGPERGKYTGRHWWGRKSEYDDIVDPESGKAADAIAGALGMPGFELNGGQGTTIQILAPLFGERSPIQALNTMKQALLWYFWPKMIALPGDFPGMNFEMWYEGERIVIPSPRDVPPLHGFVRALEILKQAPEKENMNPLAIVYDIDMHRPIKHLGRMALIRFPRRLQKPVDTGIDDGMNPFIGPSNHVALMRQAELVVKYVTGPPLPTDSIEYAGVFLADKDVDRVFAKAEPPTHDDWVFEFLDTREDKSIVRVAYRRIDQWLQSFVDPDPFNESAEDVAPLGAFAGSLGVLLTGQEGPGAGTHIHQTRGVAPWQGGGDGDNGQPAPTGGSQPGTKKVRPLRRSMARVVMLDEGTIFQTGSDLILTTKFRVTPALNSKGTLVSARVGVVLDGNQLENDPPAGSRQPRVLHWKDPDLRIYRAGPDQSITIPASDSGYWGVSVIMPDDLMVQLELQAEEIR